MLHHTLRQLLGEHARQAGSLITPGHLRFDFTHFEALPRERLEEIEAVANAHLRDDDPVRAYETTIDFARSQGAVALFGEKYGDIVRVVEVGDYSKELCGGTHVRHTGQVALLRLLHEGSIGSGFRRIEALTGPDALRHVNAERRLLEEIAREVGADRPAAGPGARSAAARGAQAAAVRAGEDPARGGQRRGRAPGRRPPRTSRASSWSCSGWTGRPEGELRELAPRVASAVGGNDRPAAVVLATATDKGPRVIASVNKAMLGTGATRASSCRTWARSSAAGSAGRTAWRSRAAPTPPGWIPRWPRFGRASRERADGA